MGTINFSKNTSPGPMSVSDTNQKPGKGLFGSLAGLAGSSDEQLNIKSGEDIVEKPIIGKSLADKLSVSLNTKLTKACTK